MKWMIAALLLCFSASLYAGPRIYRVTSSALNIRADSDAKAKIMTSLPRGSIVEIYERDEKPVVVKVAGTSGSWLSVLGLGGYAFSAFLERAPATFKRTAERLESCRVKNAFLECKEDVPLKLKLNAQVVILAGAYKASHEECCKGKSRVLVQKGIPAGEINLDHMIVSVIVNGANEVVTITAEHGGHGCD